MSAWSGNLKISQESDGSPQDPRIVLGLTVDEAKEVWKGMVRESVIDGVPQCGTCDFQATRLNVGTKDGKITDLYGVG